jgi:hypothetical protein
MRCWRASRRGGGGRCRKSGRHRGVDCSPANTVVNNLRLIRQIQVDISGVEHDDEGAQNLQPGTQSAIGWSWCYNLWRRPGARVFEREVLNKSPLRRCWARHGWFVRRKDRTNRRRDRPAGTTSRHLQVRGEIQEVEDKEALRPSPNCRSSLYIPQTRSDTDTCYANEY